MTSRHSKSIVRDSAEDSASIALEKDLHAKNVLVAAQKPIRAQVCCVIVYCNDENSKRDRSVNLDEKSISQEEWCLMIPFNVRLACLFLDDGGIEKEGATFTHVHSTSTPQTCLAPLLFPTTTMTQAPWIL